MLGAVQSTETRTYGNTNWIDQLTNINGTTTTYDGMGNPLNWHNASALEWEGRKLKTFTKTDGTVISYTYDENGIRTGKTAGSDSVRYILDGNRIIQEKHTDYILTFIYDDSNSLIGFNYDNGSSKAKCLEKFEKLKVEVDVVTKKFSQTMSFGEWMDFLNQTYYKNTLKKSTQTTYEERIYKKIIPKIGHHPLNQINTGTLEKFYEKLGYHKVGGFFSPEQEAEEWMYIKALGK